MGSLLCLAAIPSGYIGLGAGCFDPGTKWVACFAVLFALVAAVSARTWVMKLLSVTLLAGSVICLMAVILLDRTAFNY